MKKFSSLVLISLQVLVTVAVLASTCCAGAQSQHSGGVTLVDNIIVNEEMCNASTSQPETVLDISATLPGESAIEESVAEVETVIYPFLVVNMNLSSGTTGSPTRIADAVESLGYETTIEHYAAVTSEYMDELLASGIILSGQGSPWDDYPEEELDQFKNVIRETSLPVLGICGGHQFLALTYDGGTVDRIERLEPGEGYDGCRREYGYCEVRINTNDAIIGDAESSIMVFESHYDEVKTAPDIFEIVAANELCEVQAMRHSELPIYGVQFHPEIWEESFPDGRGILERFLEFCVDNLNNN